MTYIQETQHAFSYNPGAGHGVGRAICQLCQRGIGWGLGRGDIATRAVHQSAGGIATKNILKFDVYICTFWSTSRLESGDFSAWVSIYLSVV